MIVVAPFCAKDAALCQKQWRRIASLGNWPAGFSVLALADTKTGKESIQATTEAIKAVAGDKMSMMVVNAPEGWPQGPNAMWIAAASAITAEPWLWLEPDCTPLKPSWLEAINAEYAKKKAKYLGQRIMHEGKPMLFGCAVYPPSVSKIVIAFANQSKQAFDVAIGPLIDHEAAHSKLFANVVAPGRNEKSKIDLGKMIPETMLVHGKGKFTPVQSFKPKETDVCIVQLGRLGDILNILPVARAISAGNYQRPTGIVVHHTMMPAVKRAAYVNPLPYFGEIEDVDGAVAFASNSGYSDVRVAQLFGNRGLNIVPTESFAETQYKKIGWGSVFGKLFLEFDRRDFDAEQKLKSALTVDGEPYVVVNLKSHSSPFNDSDSVSVMDELEKTGIKLVDVSSANFSNIADMISLLDGAVAIVTVDTSLLHLANAAIAPIIAITCDYFGDRWRRSDPIRTRYADIPYSKVEPSKIAELVQGLVAERKWEPSKGDIYHVVQRRQTNLPRVVQAMVRWERLYQKGLAVPRHVWFTERNAKKLIEDKRELPFLKDVLSKGSEGVGKDDIVLFTNDDVVITPHGLNEIRKRLSYAPMVCAARMDVSKSFDEPKEKGWHHSGRDVFAFKQRWLEDNFDSIPDFILGASDWDTVMAAWARNMVGSEVNDHNVWNQHPVCELPFGTVIHIHHEKTWNHPENIDDAPSQIHNRALARMMYNRFGGMIPEWYSK